MRAVREVHGAASPRPPEVATSADRPRFLGYETILSTLPLQHAWCETGTGGDPTHDIVIVHRRRDAARQRT